MTFQQRNKKANIPFLLMCLGLFLSWISYLSLGVVLMVSGYAILNTYYLSGE